MSSESKPTGEPFVTHDGRGSEFDLFDEVRRRAEADMGRELASVWAVYEMCTYEIMGIANGFVFMDKGDARVHAEQLYKAHMKAEPMSNTTFEVRRLELVEPS